MNAHEEKISITLLKELLVLDEKTGKLHWKKRRVELFKAGKQTALHNCATWNGRYSGKQALTAKNKDGYLCGIINGMPMKSHRVVYALHNGMWPAMTIDHINGITSDNRPENLRDVSHRENSLNQRIPKNNKSGITGVHFDVVLNKFVAQIRANGKQIFIGRFFSFFDACCARKSAEISFCYHPNHGRLS